MHVVLETSVTQSKRHCHEDWLLYLSWCVHFTFVYLEHYSNVAKQMLSNVLMVSHQSIINHLNKNMLSLESSVRSRVKFVQFSRHTHNLQPKQNPNETFTFLSPMKTSENILIIEIRHNKCIVHVHSSIKWYSSAYTL